MDPEHCGLDLSAQNTGKVMMELAFSPPYRTASGVRLRTPLVVTFSGLSATAVEDRQQNGQAITLPDLSGIWVFLSLTTSDMEETSVTRQGDLFCGRRADSVHQIYREQHDDRPVIAYATFPDLIIRRSGHYRVKVTIVDMNAYEPAHCLFAVDLLILIRAFRGDTIADAGKVHEVVHSEVFEVLEVDEHSSYGKWQ